MNDSNETMSPAEISDAILPHLPFLRRYARALTGSQERGDGYTALVLEMLIADPASFDATTSARVALFSLFDRVWASASQQSASLAGPMTDLERATQAKLAALKPRSREAFLLNALEEFSVGEVAAVLDVSTAEAQMLIDAGQAAMKEQSQARVLVIEDEPIIAMDIESIVEELGHSCVGIADTHAIAVEMAKEHRPDLILTDIQLADGSSGIDAAHDILGLFEVPIIFITAYPQRLLTGERPEPTFLITKPFKRHVVEAAISQALFFDDATAIQV